MGSITGINDPSGSAIPGAAVAIRNVDTNQDRQTSKSVEAGIFDDFEHVGKRHGRRVSPLSGGLQEHADGPLDVRSGGGGTLPEGGQSGGFGPEGGEKIASSHAIESTTRLTAV